MSTLPYVHAPSSPFPFRIKNFSIILTLCVFNDFFSLVCAHKKKNIVLRIRRNTDQSGVLFVLMRLNVMNSPLNSRVCEQ